MSAEALVVVDVQQAFDDASWGPRDNPACEDNVRTLVGFWREQGLPVVLVQHAGGESSPLASGQPGHDLKPGIDGEAALRIVKSVHSAFSGTPALGPWLREQGIDAITVCGIQTNMCCETTTRVGSDLGFEVTFVVDAMHTFDKTGPDGEVLVAADASRNAATTLHEEFATVVRTADLVPRPS